MLLSRAYAYTHILTIRAVVQTALRDPDRWGPRAIMVPREYGSLAGAALIVWCWCFTLCLPAGACASLQHPQRLFLAARALGSRHGPRSLRVSLSRLAAPCDLPRRPC